MVVLTGDPNGGGVWLLASSPQGLDVFHFDEAKKAMDKIGARGAALSSLAGSQAGLAVDGAGVVWVGRALSLTRYDAKTATTQDFDLEALLHSVADEAPLLPGKRGQRVVNSVAVTPDGSKVVVSFAGSSRLLVYVPATQQWSKLEVGGPNADAFNVAVSETGVVAAAVNTRFTGRNVLAVWVGNERKETLADIGPVTYRGGTFVRSAPTLVRASDGAAIPFIVRDALADKRWAPTSPAQTAS